MSDAADPADAALARLDANQDLLRLARREEVAVPIQHLLAEEDDLGRVVLLGHWWSSWPAATMQLLAVVAKDPVLSATLAPSLVHWIGGLSPLSLVLHSVDGVLITAWPTLQGAWREAATDRPIIRKVYGLPEPPPPVTVPPWPKGTPFPRAATPRGAHARLIWCGFYCGAPTDVMTEALRAGLVRYQLRAFVEPTGELDEETVEELEADTPDAP